MRLQDKRTEPTAFPMRRFFLLLVFLFCTGALAARAQVVPDATDKSISLTAGGLGSLFQPDYGPNHLMGLGVYADLKLSRWIQVEAEGRWLRFNQFANVNQDNYLIGPRVPIRTFGRVTPYVKLLAGVGRMNFQYNYAYGRFADIAFGGGADVRLNRRWSLRAVDFEYQKWPDWAFGSLAPYGVSVGIGYKIF